MLYAHVIHSDTNKELSASPALVLPQKESAPLKFVRVAGDGSIARLHHFGVALARQDKLRRNRQFDDKIAICELNAFLSLVSSKDASRRSRPKVTRLDRCLRKVRY